MSKIIMPIMIIGATGSGKSSSLRSLPPEKTCILNTELKVLPFKNNFALNANITSTSKMLAAMKSIEKRDEIEYVVIDSLSMYCDSSVYDAYVKNEEGFSGWDGFKRHIVDILTMTKVSSKRYIIICLEQFNEANNTTCARVQGSLRGALESHMTVVLRSCVNDSLETDSGVIFQFATGQQPGLIRSSAKTPMLAFSDLYINNDVTEVYAALDKYYE